MAEVDVVENVSLLSSNIGADQSLLVAMPTEVNDNINISLSLIHI